MCRTIFVAASLIVALTHPASATLNFQRHTDVLGTTNTFEEGTGLPTRNFTFSSTVRSSSGRSSFFPQRAGMQFVIIFWAGSGLIDVIFDSTSYIFDPSAILSTENLLMTTRTWTVTYDDAAGELALYIDATHIDTKSIAPIFPGSSLFGPAAIQFLQTGPYTHLSYDDEGSVVLSLASEYYGLFGTLDTMHLWDRALNASEVARVAASPDSYTGNEAGLCVYWRTDRGYGTRVPNLGSTGAVHDGVLGQFAIGDGQTSDVFGSGCGAVSATSPMWVNKTGGVNTKPTAENVTLQVSSCCGCVAAPLTLNELPFSTRDYTGGGVDPRRAGCCDTTLLRV